MKPREKVTIMMDKDFIHWWNGRPPHIKEDQTIMLVAWQAWSKAREVDLEVLD